MNYNISDGRNGIIMQVAVNLICHTIYVWKNLHINNMLLIYYYFSYRADGEAQRGFFSAHLDPDYSCKCAKCACVQYQMPASHGRLLNQLIICLIKLPMKWPIVI